MEGGREGEGGTGSIWTTWSYDSHSLHLTQSQEIRNSLLILAAPIMSKLDQQYAESPSDKCRETDDQYNVSSQTVTSPLSLDPLPV